MDNTPNQPGLPEQDSGLVCLLLLARFHSLPAEGGQLRHQFAETGRLFDANTLLRAAKHLGLKAGVRSIPWADLCNAPLPAIACMHKERFVVLAKVTRF